MKFGGVLLCIVGTLTGIGALVGGVVVLVILQALGAI